MAGRGRRDPDRLRLLGRPRSPASSTWPRPRPTRPSGPPACWARSSRRASASPWCSTRGSPRSSSGILAFTLNGEAVLKGRSLFADRLGDEVASPLVTLVDDPTDPARLHRHRDRRRGPGHPAQLADRGRRPAACSCTTPTPPAGPAPSPPARRCAAASRARPGVGCMATVAAARHASRRPSWWPTVGDGLLVQDVVRAALGRQPGQRRLLHRRRGPAHPRRRAGRAGARVHHRLDAAAHAQGRAGGGQRPRSGCR